MNVAFGAVLLACAFVPSAGAQTIPSAGSSNTFDVATWNVEQFGSPLHGPADDDLQIRNVARVLRESGVELWALQEIDDVDRFAGLLDELGAGWAGELSSSGSNFKTAFVYDTSVVFVRRKAAVLTGSSTAFAGRPPLQIEAEIRFGAEPITAVFLTVHMKAFGDVASHQRRTEAALRLKDHIDDVLANRPVIVLGDFNDELTSSITPGHASPYAPFVEEVNSYAFLTHPLDAKNEPTWCADPACTAGATIDHILISDELFEAVRGGSAQRFVDLLGVIDRYRSTTSDHLPVIARFSFKTGTAAEDGPSPSESRLSAYPNPFVEAVRIEFAALSAGPAELTLYDVMGRSVRRVHASSRFPLPLVFRVRASGLPPGVYLAVVAHAGIRSTVRIVRAR